MSRIEWTEKTWNPVRGCSRVSPGCDHCYAMGQAHRFDAPGRPYDGLTIYRDGGNHPGVDWSGRVRLVPELLDSPRCAVPRTVNAEVRARVEERRRRVAALRSEGLTMRTIADELGCAAGTVADDIAKLDGVSSLALKRCRECNTDKPLSEFYAVRRGSAERQSRCKTCDNAKRHAPTRKGEYRPRPRKKPCRVCFDLPHRRERPVCPWCGKAFAEEVVA